MRREMRVLMAAIRRRFIGLKPDRMLERRKTETPQVMINDSFP